MAPPPLNIHPPLLNSATPWATNLENLRALLASPSTGAVTTRTSMVHGFEHQPTQHQYLFFNAASGTPDEGTSSSPEPPLGHREDSTASLNNLGYSPIPLDGYLGFLHELARDHAGGIRKTFIVSVTGTPEEIQICYSRIETAAKALPFPLAMEINLSCPNIHDAPPPAYDAEALRRYLDVLPKDPAIPIGIKTPPYTYSGQFVSLINALTPAAQSLSFITATNTLGSCLILEDLAADGWRPQLPSSGTGGMAGPPLHPLALGNVRTIRQLLDDGAELRHVRVIGVGGVRDGDGYRRMRAVGAYAVAVGTGVGKQGTGVFARIERDVKGAW